MTDHTFRNALNAPQIWGFALFAALGPSLSILFPRVMAGVLPVIALLALVGLWLSQRRLPQMERMPWVIAGLVVALCALSAFWSPDALFVLDSTARMAGAFVGGLIVFFAANELSPEQRHVLRQIFLGGFLFGLFLVCFNELTNSAAIRPFLSERDILELGQRGNRGMVVLSLMLWPALYAAQTIAVERLDRRRIALLLIPLTFMASLITDSQTASASVLIASLIYLLARFWPRPTGAVVAWGGGMFILTLPCLILLLRHYDPGISFDWREASVGARVEIWYAVADAAMRSPIIGYGLDAARFMSNWGMAHLYYPFDTILHPHNGVLQIWLEFGLIGAAIAVIVWLATVRRIGRMPERELGATLALLASVALASTISHGLWQSWWLGAVGLCPAMIRMLR